MDFACELGVKTRTAVHACTTEMKNLELSTFLAKESVTGNPCMLEESEDNRDQQEQTDMNF